MRRLRSAPVFLAGALLLASAPAQAQVTAPDIIDMVGAAQTERMATVNNYTTTQDVAGQTVVTYFEKTGEEAGIPVFEPKLTIVGGIRAPMSEGSEDDGMNGLVSRIQAAKERAVLEDPVMVDGRPAWVLRFTGVDEMGWSAPSTGQDSFVPRVVVIRIDQEYRVPVGLRFEGEAEIEGGMRDVSVDIALTDFREVDSMLHPFRMSFSQEGILGGADGAQAAEARAQIEAARAQLASLPEAQRNMMARVIEEQAAAIEAMFAGEPIVMITTDLKVNAGPPGGD